MLFLVVDNLLKALEVTWKGMLGIFVVIGLIALTIFLLHKFTNKEPKNQEKEDKE